MVALNFGVPEEKIADFCRKWKVQQLSVFGSAVSGKLRPDSDIDLLVSFAPAADWSMFDHYRMEDELTGIFAREVDLISRQAIEENSNWICRREIFDNAKVIYAA
ncbi:MAG: nucleotidyltransferase family protein [Phycisphaerae bacterium]|jgi:hypothetical protein